MTELGCGQEHTRKWLNLKRALSSLSYGGKRSPKKLDIGQDQPVLVCCDLIFLSGTKFGMTIRNIGPEVNQPLLKEII